MKHVNYMLFEIIKYKIEFLECLEYSMETYTLNKSEVNKYLSYLKNNFENGTYKEIISSLFNNYDLINSNLKSFFKKNYNRKIIGTINSNKSTNKINFIKQLIDCYDTFENIINAFLVEEELKKEIDSKILELEKINNEHFINFLYFIMFNMYSCSLYNDKTNLIIKENDIKEIVSIIKYCSSNNDFSTSLKTLEDTNEQKINEELKKLSNICIELEKKQSNHLKEIINLLNKEIQNDKN